MSEVIVRCPNCKTVIPEDFIEDHEVLTCKRCERKGSNYCCFPLNYEKGLCVQCVKEDIAKEKQNAG